jgi:hypothetical protein
MTLSKKEIALKLGYVFPNDRVDYRKLNKVLIDPILLNSLGLTAGAITKMHKERFNIIQSKIILSHFNITSK